MTGINLKQLRDKAGLSQKELADRIDKTQTQISRYEDNPGNVPFDIIMKLLQALGVDMATAISEAQPKIELGLDFGDPYNSLKREFSLLREFVDVAPKGIEDLPEGSPTTKDLVELSKILGRKPNLAVFGPFDSGKSTINNTLLGEEYLPTSYQPATKVPTYVRHIEDRPAWMKEQVWMLGKDFSPLKWEEEEHCREHKVVAGGLETLREHGSHNGKFAKTNDAHFALIFVDSPFLKGCNVIDLPGFDNDTEDTAKAKSNSIPVDIAIYVKGYVGFMGGADLTRLGLIIRTLPVFESESQNFPTLGNLFIIATHTASTVSEEDLAALLTKACERTYRNISESVLKERGKVSNRNIKLEDLRKRFFSFYQEIPERRKRFEVILEELLLNHLPEVWKKRSDAEIVAFKKNAKLHLVNLIDSYQKMLKDIHKVEEEFQRVNEGEPERKRERERIRLEIESSIESYKQESKKAIDKIEREIINVEYIEEVITDQFESKKEAQEYATSYLFEQFQYKVEQKTNKLSEIFAKKVQSYLEKFTKTNLSIPGQQVSVSIPFNAEGAFIGGLAGTATVGALAIWAASLGNLGAYIIAAKVVSLLSALGISTGGTATIMSAMAALGGPVTIAAGIVALFVIGGWALFGASWQHRLAKKIVAELNNTDIAGKFRTSIEEYWKSTLSSFSKGACEVEKKWKEYMDDLENIVLEQANGKDEMEQRLTRIETARDFFAGIPWRSSE